MSIIDQAIENDEQHAKDSEGRYIRLQKIDEYINKIMYTSEELRAVLHALVDEYYSKPEVVGGNIPMDWPHTDPVLKYVLTHKIPDRMKRNSVLFKNLAIGLVYSGLSESEIDNYVHKIIANCPGKNINELMGWVKKIRRDMENGRDWNYNRAEMNVWIKEANEHGG